MVQEVTMREIDAIFEVTDRLGIHREALVIPLGARTPGRVRRMPNGKIEIVVDSGVEFGDWVAGLEAAIAAASASAPAAAPAGRKLL